MTMQFLLYSDNNFNCSAQKHIQILQEIKKSTGSTNVIKKIKQKQDT